MVLYYSAQLHFCGCITMLVLMYTCQKICDKKLYILSTVSVKWILPKGKKKVGVFFLRRKDEKWNPFDLFANISEFELVLEKAKEMDEQVKSASNSKVKLMLIQIISTKTKQYWRTDCPVCHEPVSSSAEFSWKRGAVFWHWRQLGPWEFCFRLKINKRKFAFAFKCVVKTVKLLVKSKPVYHTVNPQAKCLLLVGPACCQLSLSSTWVTSGHRGREPAVQQVEMSHLAEPYI